MTIRVAVGLRSVSRSVLEVSLLGSDPRGIIYG